MKLHILPAIRLTLVTILLFCGVFPLFIWLVAQAAPNKGEGATLSVNNKVVGYALEGQSFTKDNYFCGRPSAVGYNAAGSGGSNKGPSNPDYLKDVNSRIDSFIAHNPTVQKAQIPSELVTASGSGLDPHISEQAALIQIDRIAKIRHIAPAQLQTLVQKSVEPPLMGLMGTSVVNVLQLNVALDNLK